jgi:hypothetical protein
MKLTASNAIHGNMYGWSVSISGDYAMIGAYGKMPAGAAYIYSGFSLDPSERIGHVPGPPQDLANETLVGVSRTNPADFSLLQNHPNPFNPSTTIRYALKLKEDAHAVLRIYNMLGQHVNTLVDEPEVAGYHHVSWNGRNGIGETVASGIYIYRLTAGSFTSSKKMMVVK